MVSTTPRNTQDWGWKNTVICLNIVHSSLDFHCLCTFTRVEYQKGLHRIYYLYLYSSQEKPYNVPLGMDFQLNLPKPVKKWKIKKALSQAINTAIIKSAMQLLALKQFSLLGHLKLHMYKNAVNYTSSTWSCIMDRSIFLLESFSNLLLISNAIISTHQHLGWLVITYKITVTCCIIIITLHKDMNLYLTVP